VLTGNVTNHAYLENNPFDRPFRARCTVPALAIFERSISFLYTAQNMATASELRQILKEDASGNNTYDHLVEVLMKILIDRPKDVYGSLEQLSLAVKANPLNPDPLVGKPLPPSSAEVCL
jgi:hypothetical protein